MNFEDSFKYGLREPKLSKCQDILPINFKEEINRLEISTLASLCRSENQKISTLMAHAMSKMAMIYEKISSKNLIEDAFVRKYMERVQFMQETSIAGWFINAEPIQKIIFFKITRFLRATQQVEVIYSEEISEEEKEMIDIQITIARGIEIQLFTILSEEEIRKMWTLIDFGEEDKIKMLEHNERLEMKELRSLDKIIEQRIEKRGKEVAGFNKFKNSQSKFNKFKLQPPTKVKQIKKNKNYNNLLINNYNIKNYGLELSLVQMSNQISQIESNIKNQNFNTSQIEINNSVMESWKVDMSAHMSSHEEKITMLLKANESNNHLEKAVNEIYGIVQNMMNNFQQGGMDINGILTFSNIINVGLEKIAMMLENIATSSKKISDEQIKGGDVHKGLERIAKSIDDNSQMSIENFIKLGQTIEKTIRNIIESSNDKIKKEKRKTENETLNYIYIYGKNIHDSTEALLNTMNTLINIKEEESKNIWKHKETMEIETRFTFYQDRITTAVKEEIKNLEEKMNRNLEQKINGIKKEMTIEKEKGTQNCIDCQCMEKIKGVENKIKENKKDNEEERINYLNNIEKEIENIKKKIDDSIQNINTKRIESVVNTRMTHILKQRKRDEISQFEDVKLTVQTSLFDIESRIENLWGKRYKEGKYSMPISLINYMKKKIFSLSNSTKSEGFSLREEESRSSDEFMSSSEESEVGKKAQKFFKEFESINIHKIGGKWKDRVEQIERDTEKEQKIEEYRHPQDKKIKGYRFSIEDLRTKKKSPEKKEGSEGYEAKFAEKTLKGKGSPGGQKDPPISMGRDEI